MDDLLLAAQFAGQAAARLAGVDGQTPPVEVPAARGRRVPVTSRATARAIRWTSER